VEGEPLGICPCCGLSLETAAPEDELRPGDGWCGTCRLIVLREVRGRPDWAITCPTHGPIPSK
jgi:hypothetical protein